MDRKYPLLNVLIFCKKKMVCHTEKILKNNEGTGP